ncbi:MAG: secretion system protein [Chloroflexi bacterium]|jgi:tight adherence protein B|nr:secretion system protein [Chloroflexota bacterium]BCY18482.1 secretion system protein [Leptolinea sp. HRD-7]
MSLMVFFIAGAAVSVMLLIIGIIVSVRSDRDIVDERLGRFVDTEVAEEELKKQAATPLTDWINKRVEGSSGGDRLAKELARADLKLKPGEFIAVIIIAAFGVGLVLWFFSGQSLIMGILGAIGGSFLPRMYLKSQQGKRLQKFDEQLPDMLNLMVNGLRAGFSTLQAMEAVSRELPPPICDEFRRVVQEMQLGITMEKALDNLLRRIPSDDLDLCITAMNVQREVGGNLAEILDTISYTIRERVRIKGEIRVLTAQVMYSGRFLSLLPLIVIGVLYLLNREYMMEFFKAENVPCGYIALGLGGLLIIVGYLVMNKLGEIEV